jgi:soluble lytic murein transglycosylase-like protein/LysM repeat protein
MRLLQIALIVLVSSSLIVHNSDSVAAAGKHSSKGHKSHGRSKGKRHKADANPGDVWQRIRAGIRIPRPSPEIAGFGQIVAAKNKNLSASSSEVTKTTDSTKALGDESNRLTTVITPKKLIGGGSQLPEKLRLRQTLMPKDSQLSPADNYTRLGRLKLAPKGSSISLNNRLSKKIHLTPDEKLSLEANNGLFKSSSVQRIRTRLGLHPELFKGGEVAEASAPDKPGSNSKAPNQGQSAIRGCSDLNKQNVINLAKQGVLPGSYSQMAEQCQNSQRSKYERLTRQIAGYSQRKGVLYQASERARPYLYHIVSELSKHNLPLDLALLPIVESAYQPTALSPMSAAGIWQFIPSTGREYGLEQRADYDGRLDITASTRAAIRFLSGLNAHFKGDWLLSLAAYNAGQGTVDAAISRNQAEGLDTDFWSLDLPTETEDYVPRLLALSAIFSSPGSYGLKLRPIKNEPYFIKVDIDRETDINHLVQKDLKTIAKLADFEAEQFGLLNSAYLKAAITESRPFTLLMPISNANLLHKSLAFMTQSGEVEEKTALPLFPELELSSEFIERKVQTPLLLINLNEDQQWPYKSEQLAMGIKPVSADNEMKMAKATGEDYLAVHYLDKGESLREVAENHGLSEEMLRAANKFKRRQSISLGQRLLIPLKKITAATMSVNKMNTSVLYKRITANLNPLSRL